MNHLLDEGLGASEIRDTLGMNEYKVKIYIPAAKRYGSDRLSMIISQLAKTDADSKFGGVTGYTAVEMFISRYL